MDKKGLNNSVEEREQFSSKIGFILACIGSAIGMGNIWMFPWRVGKYGGAAFLVPYLLFVLILGSTGLITEFSIGRLMKSGPIAAFRAIYEERGKSYGGILGIIPIVGISCIAIGYAIVVGWILKYLSLAMTGNLLTQDPGAFFGSFVTSSEPIAWHLLAIIFTISLLVTGVTNGIEKVNKIIMPGFFIMFFILMIRSITLPGASAGIRYLLIPDWSYLLQPMTWIMAMGQAFFTVSLGGAGMVVYGSYIGDDMDIPNSALNTAVFDTLGALIAAFVVIPPIFAFGLDPTAGPPLLFISLPLVFQQLPMGNLFAVLFFTSVLFAAISSLLNLLEAPIEALIEKMNLTRKTAGIAIGLSFFIIGLILDIGIIDLGNWMDFASIYLIPAGAIVAAFVLYWVYGADRALEEVNKGAKVKLGQGFTFLGKYVYTIVAVFVLVLGVIYGGIG